MMVAVFPAASVRMSVSVYSKLQPMLIIFKLGELQISG
jgi:hypothetical protein